MTKEKKVPDGSVADAIRAGIRKIPSGELAEAKPRMVYPHLEAAGYEITNAVKAATSKLLGQAKETAEKPTEGKVIEFDPNFIEKTERHELAMRFVEACNFNFDLVRTEIARLEQFAKKIKGA